MLDPKKVSFGNIVTYYVPALHMHSNADSLSSEIDLAIKQEEGKWANGDHQTRCMVAVLGK